MAHEIEPSEVSAGRRAGKVVTGGKIATGNRLRDGVVIYFDGKEWVPDVDKAKVAHTAEDEAALKGALDAAVKANHLIDAAVIDLVQNETKPARLREQIRAVGPTVRLDLARRPNW